MLTPNIFEMQKRQDLVPRQLLPGLGGGNDDDDDDNDRGGGLLDPLLTPIIGGGQPETQTEIQTATRTGTTTANIGTATPAPGPVNTIQTETNVNTLPSTTSVPPTSLSSIAAPSLSASQTASAAPSISVVAPPPVQASAVTTSDPTLGVVTKIVEATSSAAVQSNAAGANAPSGFLQNKAASGAVFGIAGLIGLALLCAIVAFVVRRSRNKRLLNEAISFDPASMNNARDMEHGSMEKTGIYRSPSNSSHGHSAGMAGYGSAGAYGPNYGAPAQGYSDYSFASPAAQMYNVPQPVPSPVHAGFSNATYQPPSARTNQIPRVPPPASADFDDPYGGYEANQVPQSSADVSRDRFSAGSVAENPYLGRNLKVANE